MRNLELDIVGASAKTIDVKWVFNAWHAGYNTEEVRYHSEELAVLGIPALKTFPTLSPLGAHVISQKTYLSAPHGKTSGEDE